MTVVGLLIFSLNSKGTLLFRTAHFSMKRSDDHSKFADRDPISLDGAAA
jgi:hypothetical protein